MLPLHLQVYLPLHGVFQNRFKLAQTEESYEIKDCRVRKHEARVCRVVFSGRVAGGAGRVVGRDRDGRGRARCR